MADDDPMAKYVAGMPDELQDILSKWSDDIAENEALTARAVAAETALAAEKGCADELNIAIHGGCGCPAPYTECPHDEPLLPALNDARTKLAAAKTRAVAAETALAATDEAVTELLMAIAAEQPGFQWTAERTADAVDVLTKVVLPLLDVPDQPTPSGDEPNP